MRFNLYGKAATLEYPFILDIDALYCGLQSTTKENSFAMLRIVSRFSIIVFAFYSESRADWRQCLYITILFYTAAVNTTHSTDTCRSSRLYCVIFVGHGAAGEYDATYHSLHAHRSSANITTLDYKLLRYVMYGLYIFEIR